MKTLPARFESIRQLEEFMSSPSEALVEYWKHLDGDVMIIGAGGKIGPTMAMMAKRAADMAGVHKEIIAVDRQPLADLEKEGIRTLQCDLLDRKSVGQLPRVQNIVFMAGRKFGSSGNE